MKWRISCPFCGASYSVEADVFGKQCECGKCKQIFSVKAPDPADVVPVAGERRRAENQDYRDDSRVVLCPNCFKEIALNNDFCPHCGYGLRNIPRAGGKPFLCYLLNILGWFCVLPGFLSLVLFGLAAGEAYFHPSEIDRMFPSRASTFTKGVLTSFAVSFGGLILFGISSVINRASRRW